MYNATIVIEALHAFSFHPVLLPDHISAGFVRRYRCEGSNVFRLYVIADCKHVLTIHHLILITLRREIKNRFGDLSRRY